MIETKKLVEIDLKEILKKTSIAPKTNFKVDLRQLDEEIKKKSHKDKI